jgi:hypothetical protein
MKLKALLPMATAVLNGIALMGLLLVLPNLVPFNSSVSDVFAARHPQSSEDFERAFASAYSSAKAYESRLRILAYSCIAIVCANALMGLGCVIAVRRAQDRT